MKRVLKFFSPTCGPCRVMSKILSTLEGVKVQDVDVTDEDNQSLLDKWKPRIVPTIIILNEEDQLVKEFRGIVSIDKIKEVL